ncbi:hypothetical protein SLUDD06_01749 [Streptococcus lutetiensis]|nr:hypothetical protein SLUDD06_01749 [Streptococcus lutetiensis]
MVPKHKQDYLPQSFCFRAVLFRMVPKLLGLFRYRTEVLELCCFEWFQNF